jgi:hypothetical protein
VTYVKTNGNPAVLSEISAVTSDGSKCIYIGDIITQEQKLSTAGGNLGCFGTPYASSVFTFSNISDVSYINDGLIEKDSYIWIPETPACPAYCGIVLDKKAKVDTVVLYFNDGIIGQYNARDYFVFGFDVQAKIDGEFVTVAKGTSYNAAKEEYIVSIEFDEVEATDIRIAFTDIDIGFTYIKELEVYGSTRYNDFSTYAHGRKNVAKTTSFGDAFVIGRANFSVLANPLRTMLTINDIRASLWI